MRSSYTYFDAYQWHDLDDTVICALARLVQKIFAKISRHPCRYFDFSCDIIFFTWLENDQDKKCRCRSRKSNAVYRLSLACFVFEISGVGYPPVSTKLRRCAGRWKRADTDAYKINHGFSMRRFPRPAIHISPVMRFRQTDICWNYCIDQRKLDKSDLIAWRTTTHKPTCKLNYVGIMRGNTEEYNCKMLTLV